jgi:hypothetical protein
MEETLDLGELSLAPDEAGELDREIVGTARRRRGTRPRGE